MATNKFKYMTSPEGAYPKGSYYDKPYFYKDLRGNIFGNMDYADEIIGVNVWNNKPIEVNTPSSSPTETNGSTRPLGSFGGFDPFSWLLAGGQALLQWSTQQAQTLQTNEDTFRSMVRNAKYNMANRLVSRKGIALKEDTENRNYNYTIGDVGGLPNLIPTSTVGESGRGIRGMDSINYTHNTALKQLALGRESLDIEQNAEREQLANAGRTWSMQSPWWEFGTQNAGRQRTVDETTGGIYG